MDSIRLYKISLISACSFNIRYLTYLTVRKISWKISVWKVELYEISTLYARWTFLLFDVLFFYRLLFYTRFNIRMLSSVFRHIICPSLSTVIVFLRNKLSNFIFFSNPHDSVKSHSRSRTQYFRIIASHGVKMHSLLYYHMYYKLKHIIIKGARSNTNQVNLWMGTVPRKAR